MIGMSNNAPASRCLFCSLVLFALYVYQTNHADIRKEVRKSIYRRQLREGDFQRNPAIQRPVMHTFFEPVKGGCCGMTEQGHNNLVKAWNDAWQKRGWETKILTEADARSHAHFDKIDNLLIKANVNAYNRRCFWRWLAMSSQANGGWMSDYDNFPLALTAELGLELQKIKGFKTWNRHIPSLLHGDKKSWNKIVGLMMNVVLKPDLKVKIISDMQLLLFLHKHMSEEEMGVSTWQNEVHNGFPYVRGGDGKGPKIDCEVASQSLTAHLSHHDSRDAVENSHTYPRIEGMPWHAFVEKRVEAATIMMKDYEDHCVKKDFQTRAEGRSTTS